MTEQEKQARIEELQAEITALQMEIEQKRYILQSLIDERPKYTREVDINSKVYSMFGKKQSELTPEERRLYNKFMKRQSRARMKNS